MTTDTTPLAFITGELLALGDLAIDRRGLQPERLIKHLLLDPERLRMLYVHTFCDARGTISTRNASP